jgi:hypothetical protein
MATQSGQLVMSDQTLNSQFQFVAAIDGMTFDTPAPIHAGPGGLYTPRNRGSRRSAERPKATRAHIKTARRRGTRA